MAFDFDEFPHNGRPHHLLRRISSTYYVDRYNLPNSKGTIPIKFVGLSPISSSLLGLGTWIIFIPKYIDNRWEHLACCSSCFDWRPWIISYDIIRIIISLQRLNGLRRRHFTGWLYNRWPRLILWRPDG